jgi:hypothetical protein
MDLMPGTILRRVLGGFAGWLSCFHVAIYLGNGLVIHFNGETKGNRNAVVRIDSLEEFANGRPVSVHGAPKNERHGEATCREARRLHDLGQANGWNYLYNFALHNCEDFCNHCYELAYD